MSEVTTFKRILNDCLKVAPADILAAGSKGLAFVDIAKITVPGEYEQGELLMSGADGFVQSTKEGINTATEICILSEYVVLKENETAYAAAYFSGEFNADLVVFPFETEDDNHNEIADSVRVPLRRAKIFLRHTH